MASGSVDYSFFYDAIEVWVDNSELIIFNSNITQIYGVGRCRGTNADVHTSNKRTIGVDVTSYLLLN